MATFSRNGLNIDDRADGRAEMYVTPEGDRPVRWLVDEGDRVKAAQALAGDDHLVVSKDTRNSATTAIKLKDAVSDLVEAIRLSVEYAGTDVLRPVEGWTWYDALVKYAPKVAEQLKAQEERRVAQQLETESVAAEAGSNLDADYVRNAPQIPGGPEDTRTVQIAGNCPSCKHPRLEANKFGHIVCTNERCEKPDAVTHTLIDSDPRCRCGKLRVEYNPECAWHQARSEDGHLGWVIVPAGNASYPHVLGEYTALGPQVFTDADENVINYRGENYYRHTELPRRFGIDEQGFDQLVSTFKQAWHAADNLGKTGSRTRGGLSEVLGRLSTMLAGESVEVSELQAGDYVRAKFTEDEGLRSKGVRDTTLTVEGELYETVNGRLAVVRSPYLVVRTETGLPGNNLDKVFMLRKNPDRGPEPNEVEHIKTILADFAAQEMTLTSGDLPYRLARELERRRSS